MTENHASLKEISKPPEMIDYKELVKVVLTRSERHEVRQLAEEKRAGTLGMEGKIRLRELKDKLSRAAIVAVTAIEAREDGDDSNHRPTSCAEEQEFEHKKSAHTSDPWITSTIGEVSLKHQSQPMSNVNEIKSAELLVGRAVMNEACSQGIVTAIKLIAGVDKMFFKVRCVSFLFL
jgi:hypothetical protein